MTKKQKSSATSSAINNSSLIEYFRQGYSISKIADEYNIPRTTLDYHIKPLRIKGIIKNLGCGVWAVNEEKAKEFLQNRDENSSAVAKHRSQKIRHPIRHPLKKVRGHGFQIVLKIPKIKNWDKRREYLDRNKIDYTPIGTNWSGERLLINGIKVWLTPISVVFYAPHLLSWFGQTAKDAKNHAIYDFLQTVHKVERLLDIDSFRINKEYVFKVSRQHYGLVKNALAVQYDREGKKLHCYAKKGWWMVIDNSYNLHELETLHPEDADIDNAKVQDFFNSLERNPIRVDQILETFNQIAEIQLAEQEKWGFYAENIESHTKAIIKLDKGIARLTEIRDRPPLSTRTKDTIKWTLFRLTHRRDW